MPKLKKPDDLIIEDEEMRTLLTALQGKWGDEQSQSLLNLVEKRLRKIVAEGDARLVQKYGQSSYNRGTGRTNSETLREVIDARAKQLDEVGMFFQISIGPAVKAVLLATIEAVVQLAGNAPTLAQEERIKAAVEKRDSERRTRVKSLVRDWRTSNRSTRTKQRIVEIIKSCGGLVPTKTKVAWVFYGKTEDLKKADQEERNKVLDRLNKLLDSQGLDYGIIKQEALEISSLD